MGSGTAGTPPEPGDLGKEATTSTTIIRTIDVTLDLELIEGDEDHVIELTDAELSAYVKDWVERRVSDITDSLA